MVSLTPGKDEIAEGNYFGFSDVNMSASLEMSCVCVAYAQHLSTKVRVNFDAVKLAGLRRDASDKRSCVSKTFNLQLIDFPSHSRNLNFSEITFSPPQISPV